MRSTNFDKKYYEEIDILKGIAILIVILGHCLCTDPINLGQHFPIMAKIIHSIQMPLFFVASGFLFSVKGGFSTLIKKKSARLLIPYICFGILSASLRYIFSAFTRSGEVEISTLLLKLLNGESYWFLYSLILIMFIVQLIKNNALLHTVALLCIALCLFTDICEINFLTLGKIVYYLPFFILGMQTKKYYEIVLNTFERYKIMLVIAIPVLFIISLFVFTQFSFSQMFISPLLGIMIVFWGSKAITRYAAIPIVKFLTHFGMYSLQYYLNHLLIMLPLYYIAGRINIVSPIIPLLFIFCCAVVISYIMLRIELSSKITRIFCGLGK